MFTICVVSCNINTSVGNVALYLRCLRLYHTEIKTQGFILKLKRLGLQPSDLGSLWRYGCSVSLTFAPGGVQTHSKLQPYATGEEDFLTGEIHFFSRNVHIGCQDCPASRSVGISGLSSVVRRLDREVDHSTQSSAVVSKFTNLIYLHGYILNFIPLCRQSVRKG